jgi:transposase-like protein
MSSDTANRGPYKCQHCGKTFNTQDELDKHERSDASGGNLK